MIIRGIDGDCFGDNSEYCKRQLEKIFEEWHVNDDLEITQSQSAKYVRIITEVQIGQIMSLGLVISAMSIDPNCIWIKFAIINNGATGGGGIL